MSTPLFYRNSEDLTIDDQGQTLWVDRGSLWQLQNDGHTLFLIDDDRHIEVSLDQREDPPFYVVKNP